MATINQTKCCGIGEIDRLGTNPLPGEALKDVVRGIIDSGYVFVTFSGVTTRFQRDHTHVGRADDYGQKFEDYITRNRLGKVTRTDTVVNPKTWNHIRLWSWEVDKDALRGWAHINGVWP